MISELSEHILLDLALRRENGSNKVYDLAKKGYQPYDESGVTMEPDRLGQENGAWYFDGAAHINVDDLMDLIDGNTTGCIAFWMKSDLETAVGDSDYPFSVVDDGSGDTLRFYLNSSSLMTYQVSAPGNLSRLQTQVTANEIFLPEGERWCHFCAVQDGSEAKFYLNGNDFDITHTGTDATAWVDDLAGSPLVRIGCWFESGNESRWFEGAIDSIKWFQTVPSNDEVRELFARELEEFGVVHRMDTPMVRFHDYQGTTNDNCLDMGITGAEASQDISFIGCFRINEASIDASVSFMGNQVTIANGGFKFFFNGNFSTDNPLPIVFRVNDGLGGGNQDISSTTTFNWGDEVFYAACFNMTTGEVSAWVKNLTKETDLETITPATYGGTADFDSGNNIAMMSDQVTGGLYLRGQIYNAYIERYHLLDIDDVNLALEQVLRGEQIDLGETHVYTSNFTAGATDVNGNGTTVTGNHDEAGKTDTLKVTLDSSTGISHTANNRVDAQVTQYRYYRVEFEYFVPESNEFSLGLAVRSINGTDPLSYENYNAERGRWITVGPEDNVIVRVESTAEGFLYILAKDDGTLSYDGNGSDYMLFKNMKYTELRRPYINKRGMNMFFDYDDIDGAPGNAGLLNGNGNYFTTSGLTLNGSSDANIKHLVRIPEGASEAVIMGGSAANDGIPYGIAAHPSQDINGIHPDLTAAVIDGVEYTQVSASLGRDDFWNILADRQWHWVTAKDYDLTANLGANQLSFNFYQPSPNIWDGIIEYAGTWIDIDGDDVFENEWDGLGDSLTTGVNDFTVTGAVTPVGVHSVYDGFKTLPARPGTKTIDYEGIFKVNASASPVKAVDNPSPVHSGLVYDFDNATIDIGRLRGVVSGFRKGGISSWVYVKALSAAQLCWFGEDGQDNSFRVFLRADGHIEVYSERDGGYRFRIVTDAQVIFPGNAYHIAVIQPGTGNNPELYVNLEKPAQTKTGGGQDNWFYYIAEANGHAFTDMLLGDDPAGDYPFSLCGYMWDFTIWSKYPTLRELKRDAYRQGKILNDKRGGKFPGMVADFRPDLSGTVLQMDNKIMNDFDLDGVSWNLLPNGRHALVFQSANTDYARNNRFSTLFKGVQNFTFMTWIRCATISVGQQILIIYGPSSSYVDLRISSGNALKFAVANTAGTVQVDRRSSTSVIAADTWYHVAFRRTEGITNPYEIFLDGVKVDDNYVTDVDRDYFFDDMTGDFDGATYIGAQLATTANFDGDIGNSFIVAKRALSDAEIMKHYKKFNF